ncbi:hypothetical protein BBJ28_00026350 [Nothophytophthora sp. Chile5]|nr:hypothetical protein BBJ28_00026350 [Nothophytophthora sp. Chile5]
MGEAMAMADAPDGALGHLLVLLDTHEIETMRGKLLAGVVGNPEPLRGLQTVQELAETLPNASDLEFVALHQNLIRVIKALCSVVIKYVSVVASNPDNVVAIVALDDNLLPILRVLQRFVERQTPRDLETSYSHKELLRWVPFVLTACYFVDCGELPGSDMLQSVAVAGDVLAACASLTQTEDRAHLLAQYVGQIVALCSQDVAKDEWVAVSSLNKLVLLNVVEQVPFPHLGGDLLGRLLALIFPLVDDLTDATQLIGARLLRHVVRNVTATELRWFSDVLLEVLLTAITSRKPATLDALLDSLVESLDKVSPPGELKHYDRFVPRLLSDTSLSSDVTVRVIFVRHLRVIVSRIGAPHSLHVIRYLQPLLKVLVAGFESINVTLLVETLETLRVTILSAWPRIASHTEEIVVGVLRAVAFCELFEAGGTHTPSKAEKEQVLVLCEGVLLLLHDVNSSPSIVSDMLMTVRRQSGKLAPFCDRVLAKTSAQSTSTSRLLASVDQAVN